MRILTLGLLLLFSITVGCNQKKNNTKAATTEESSSAVEYVNSMRVKTPRRAHLFPYGTPIKIVVNGKKRFGKIDSIQLFGDDKLVSTLKEEPWQWHWTPAKNKMGKHSLKLLAYHKNGKVGVVNSYVNIKSNKVPTQYGYKVVSTYPHDRKAYTQGLFFANGYLYESTGRQGESSLRKVNLKDGKLLSVNALSREYFGEGITLYKDKIIQLTWQSRKAFVLNIDTFEEEDTFSPATTNGEGWGITTVKDELVISDGSNVLSFIDANDYHLKHTIEVYDNKGKVLSLNELEYINGKIYANVWLTDKIVIINPESGAVEGELNLKGILKPAFRQRLDPRDDVLNGIAWDSQKQRIFVTGKHWPKLFEIEVIK